MTPQLIKTFRDRRDWNQQQLAERLGVNQATVSRLETGKLNPSGPVKLLFEMLVAESEQAGAQ